MKIRKAATKFTAMKIMPLNQQAKRKTDRKALVLVFSRARQMKEQWGCEHSQYQNEKKK